MGKRGDNNIVPLDLVSSPGEHVDVHVVAVLVAMADLTTGIGMQGASSRKGVSGVGMRRRHVGRSNSRGGSRVDFPGPWRRHHATVSLHGSDKTLVMNLLPLVASPGVWVVMNPRVSGKLIGAGELFAAPRELASMGLLSSMGSDMSGLVLKTMEGLIAQRALVGSGQFGCGLHVLSSRQGAVGS